MKSDALNIKKIAELADCSSSTVSRVLSGRVNSIKISESTRARIMEVCERMDYHPSIHASRLFSKRSRMIGFLVALETLWDDENLSRSLFGVCSALFRSNYRALPLIYDRKFEEGKEYLNIFNRQEVDGLIVWGAQENQRFLAELTEAKRPFALLTNPVAGYPSVSSDQRNAVAELVTLCRSRGAKRFTAVMDREGASFQQRELGFLDGTAGLEAKVLIARQTVDSAYNIGDEVMKNSPDAIICGNDETAVGIERYLLERKIRIPEDVLLTGGDNIKLSAHCQVPLTTFDQCAVACAERCVEMLLAHLDGGAALSSIQLSAPLVLRSSTARA